MNLQIFPNSCGIEYSELWCPLTDGASWIIVLSATTIMLLLLKYIFPKFSEVNLKYDKMQG